MAPNPPPGTTAFRPKRRLPSSRRRFGTSGERRRRLSAIGRMAGPFICLLTDFGARDPSAGILHGVILGIAPDARIVDISHEVRKYAIRDGALLLWCAVP